MHFIISFIFVIIILIILSLLSLQSSSTSTSSVDAFRIPSALSASIFGIRDYYKILGVPPFASQETIKQKFKQLSKNWHPDRQLSSSSSGSENTKIKNLSRQELVALITERHRREERNGLLLKDKDAKKEIVLEDLSHEIRKEIYTLIVEAKGVLSDPEQRSLYDWTGMLESAFPDEFVLQEEKEDKTTKKKPKAKKNKNDDNDDDEGKTRSKGKWAEETKRAKEEAANGRNEDSFFSPREMVKYAVTQFELLPYYILLALGVRWLLTLFLSLF